MDTQELSPRHKLSIVAFVWLCNCLLQVKLNVHCHVLYSLQKKDNVSMHIIVVSKDCGSFLATVVNYHRGCFGVTDPLLSHNRVHIKINDFCMHY